MKHEIVILQLIRSSEYDKLELKHQYLVFYKLTECIIKKICHGVKQNAKICASGETKCNLKSLS